MVRTDRLDGQVDRSIASIRGREQDHQVGMRLGYVRGVPALESRLEVRDPSEAVRELARRGGYCRRRIIQVA
jgi:hypothetical protein